jgi:hypothetical protein
MENKILKAFSLYLVFLFAVMFIYTLFFMIHARENVWVFRALLCMLYVYSATASPLFFLFKKNKPKSGKSFVKTLKEMYTRVIVFSYFILIGYAMLFYAIDYYGVGDIYISDRVMASFLGFIWLFPFLLLFRYWLELLHTKDTEIKIQKNY